MTGFQPVQSRILENDIEMDVIVDHTERKVPHYNRTMRQPGVARNIRSRPTSRSNELNSEPLGDSPEYKQYIENNSLLMIGKGPF